MNPLWDYAWPIALLALLAGAIGGLFGLRRKRPLIIIAAAALTLAATVVWHGPAGAANRLTSAVERQARATLVDYEMPQVQAHLHHDPLTRRLILSGTADDFQRSELARILTQIPGASSASWDQSGGFPLMAEAAALAAVGFLLGLLVAYLVELRRRYNAQWTW